MTVSLHNCEPEEQQHYLVIAMPVALDHQAMLQGLSLMI